MARWDHFHAEIEDNQTGEVIEIEGGWHRGYTENIEQIRRMVKEGSLPQGRTDHALLCIAADWIYPERMTDFTGKDPEQTRYTVKTFRLGG